MPTTPKPKPKPNRTEAYIYAYDTLTGYPDRPGTRRPAPTATRLG